MFCILVSFIFGSTISLSLPIKFLPSLFNNDSFFHGKVKSSKKEEDINWVETLQNFLPDFLRQVMALFLFHNISNEQPVSFFVLFNNNFTQVSADSLFRGISKDVGAAVRYFHKTSR